MITIFTAKDLEQFGLCYLTSESCALGIRGLWDLNEAGVELVGNFLGIPSESTFKDDKGRTITVSLKRMLAKNWNSMVNGSEAIASILLPPTVIPELSRFALFQVGCVMVIHAKGGGIYGVLPEEMELVNASGITSEHECYTNPFHRPNISGSEKTSRHLHLMSGRVE